MTDFIQVPVPTGNYGEPEELGDYNQEDILKHNVDAVYYWYCAADYEGSGVALILRGGKWAVECLGHCSGYGPTDQLELDVWYESLDDIPQSGTSAWYDDVSPCVEAARERGVA